MKKFTETITATVIREMCAEPESTIEITITNDSIFINDDETIIATYWSDAKAKTIEKAFSDYPTKDELTEMLVKSEKCDYVLF